MPISSNTAVTTTPVGLGGLESKLSQALAMYESGKNAEATSLLQDLSQDASKAGNPVLARKARTYLLALQRKNAPDSKVSKAPEEMSIQVLLNQGEAKQALDRLTTLLAKAPGKASCHYLKALALAQLGQPEASAEAMGKALGLDENLSHQFQLEKDFDGVRGHAAFGAFPRA